MKNIKLLCLWCLVLICAGYLYAGTSGPAKLTNDDCLACHNDASMVNGKGVHGDAFKTSVHGSVFSCVDCHNDVKSLPHDTGLKKPACVNCHADEKKLYDTGVHGKKQTPGTMALPSCESCHGNVHEILPSSDPKSRTARANVPVTCGNCHSQAIPGISGQIAVAYQESVHGRMTAAGNTRAAICSDCHTAHNIRPPSDPKSPVYHSNVPNTCAQCHGGQAAAFEHSIHGKLLAAGNTHAPGCTDCHGVHTIKAVADVASPVSPRNQADFACAQCHNNVKMTAEFGIPGGRVETYKDSYHGMANALGSKRTASCSSCHGSHDTLPASDPNSSINPANLARTCGQCHPGANQNFAKGQIHLNSKALAQVQFGSKVVAWVRTFYIAMIVGVVGFMLLHNLMIFVRKLMHYQQREEHFHGGPRIIERMTKNQRIQHMLLFLSFFTLVLTGFTLKFPNTFLHHLFVNETGRSLVHRIAGVVLIADGLYHIFYLAFTPEGRKMLVDMLPELKDATDMRDVFAYYLGFSSRKPQFKRFNYAEKMEYWALVWGTFIMAVTGFMIWFKVTTATHIPRWWVDVATTIHFYEAILATLAIIVWHFYQVILDPDLYPMNFAFFDGKMSVEHYEEEHGLDTETLAKYGGKHGDEVTTHNVRST